MTFPKKTIIALDLENYSRLYPVHKMDFLGDSEIQFVHIIPKIYYGDGLSFNVTFPPLEDEVLVKTAIIEKIKLLAKEILPYWHHDPKKVKYHSFYSIDPKADFCQYLAEARADLAILGSRSKHNLFENSFAYYVGLHAPCSVMVLRSQEVLHEGYP